ncbi:hypothetical protein D6D00_06650 [Aureobasidium pullulans]|nr:hypothetical protein D6D00_06650 [Aureobasidium pullulans]
MADQRVPAWKRLGLSLTNAKDSAPAPASPATSTKRSRDDADTPNSSKKQRLHQTQNGADVSSPAQKQLQPSSVAPISSPMPSRLRASPEKSILATPNSKQGRRKSVVFSNDTKKQDGDSAQTYFQAWANDELDYYAQKAADYDAAEAAKTAETGRPVDTIKFDTAQPEISQEAELALNQTKTEEEVERSPVKEDKKKSKAEKKAEKREKQEQQRLAAYKNDTTQAASDSSTPVVKKSKVRTPKDTTNKPVPEYVRYLEQYHTDRPSWKFNKSKQNDLLKNIWNIYRVPLSCNEALVEYLDGLQGAAARQRLRQTAQSANIDIVAFIRAEIPEVKDEPMETAEARKAAYDGALRRQAEKLRNAGIDPNPERTKRIQEQKDYDERVQTVYNTMSKGEPQNSARPTPKKEEPKVSARKKRKSRTDVSEIESSDSDSSDSDSSESESESEEEEKPVVKKAVAEKAKKEDSSDSESSESESESEEEKPAAKKVEKPVAEKTKKRKTRDSSDSESSDSDSDDEPASKKAKIAKLKAQLAEAKIAKLKAELAKVKAKTGKKSSSKKKSDSSESESSDDSPPEDSDSDDSD